MLTYDECLAMCDLTCDEIDAIAEHEHVDPMIALALGNYLVSHHEACEVKRFIVDDIEAARRSGNTEKMILLKQTLLHFLTTHPDACQGSHRQVA
ncbi:hypothetical protein [Nitrincola tapanii]|uniref:Uncharacterized protein n=1 Tax=Nitrincola tapanii TaxID=1708751 RepID=A0A5A9W2Y2_9GAMM|nr:hypothetical protein [Nitrincola tapanii]KAA0875106.1 hypothetical protein E1H14_06720 [Nitrincola tapanii]